MNERERFKAVARGEKPDYMPIFGFQGASLSLPPMDYVMDRLVATGMPAWVGRNRNGEKDDKSWTDYWGTAGALFLDFYPVSGAKGFKTSVKIENGYEVTESENGSLIRRKVEGSTRVYSMPEFIRYPVRDRESWEFYKSRTVPEKTMTDEEIEENCRRYDGREEPLCLHAGICGYGDIRNLFGTEGASLAFYDDPELVKDIIDNSLKHARNHVFPLVERLKPEMILKWEDMSYNHGMLISPAQFDKFFGQGYREMCDCARANGVDMVTVDSDGNIMELTGVLESYGVNGILPCEVKAGNDIFALREKYPEFIFSGWLEKESMNEGNEWMIEKEILGKVPPMMEKGRYFPNTDHFIQPLATFKNMCRFMTLLHDVCKNPEGEFPRMEQAGEK